MGLGVWFTSLAWRTWKLLFKLGTGQCELERICATQWHTPYMTARAVRSLRESRSLRRMPAAAGSATASAGA